MYWYEAILKTDNIASRIFLQSQVLLCKYIILQVLTAVVFDFYFSLSLMEEDISSPF